MATVHVRAGANRLIVRPGHPDEVGTDLKLAQGVMRIRITIAGAALAAAMLLCGCGSGKTPSAPSKQATARQNAARRADDVTRALVAAVPASKGSTLPVQVKFQLEQRPDVAQPLTVDVFILTSSAAVDRVFGKVVAEDGMDVVDGADIPPIDKPTEGALIRHTVKVLPKREGIFTLSTVVSLDVGGQVESETYFIPVIAGAGIPELPSPTAPGQPGKAAPAAKPPPTAAAQ